MKYVLTVAPNQGELTFQVNGYLRDGWTPLGPPFSTVVSPWTAGDYTYEYGQALVKETDQPQPKERSPLFTLGEIKGAWQQKYGVSHTDETGHWNEFKGLLYTISTERRARQRLAASVKRSKSRPRARKR